MAERQVLLEVCVDSAADALTACQAGADRLELNSAMSLGGLTPSTGLMEIVAEQTSIPVIAMVRPRPGNFAYRSAEIDVMCRDAIRLLEQGASGIAFGCLTTEYQIDRDATRRLLDVIRPAQAVFHRAFDCTEDATQSLEILVELGVDRILTSGRQATALAGMSMIRQLQQLADNRIEILPGSGIRADNVATLIEQTGVRQVHASLSTKIEIPPPSAGGLAFISPSVLDETSATQVSQEELERMLTALQSQ